MKRMYETGKTTALDPYQMLANAVIIQAAKDYRVALKRVMKGEIKKRWVRIDDETEMEMDVQYEKAVAEKKDIEEFFLSGRHHMYTEIDGSFMVKKLREELGFVEDQSKPKPKRIRKIMKNQENQSQSVGA